MPKKTKKSLIEGAIESFSQKGINSEELKVNLEISFMKLLTREEENINLEDNQLSPNFEVKADLSKGEISIKKFSFIVDKIDEDDPKDQILEKDSKAKGKKVGEIISEKIPLNSFNPIQLQQLKQFFIQKDRETDKEKIYEKFKDLKGTIVRAKIHKIERGNLILDYNETSIFVPSRELLSQDNFEVGSSILVYVLEVYKYAKDAQIIGSRKDSNFVIKLLEKEVNDLKNGTIVVNKIVREPGKRSKIAVSSSLQVVDPVGAIIGTRGVKIKEVMKILDYEKIDVVQFYKDKKKFIESAMLPVQILGYSFEKYVEPPVIVPSEDEDNQESKVYLEDEESSVLIIVDDSQIISAIGKYGLNIKLVSELVGIRLEIKTKTEADKQGIKYEKVVESKIESKLFDNTDNEAGIKSIEELAKMGNELEKRENKNIDDKEEDE